MYIFYTGTWMQCILINPEFPTYSCSMFKQRCGVKCMCLFFFHVWCVCCSVDERQMSGLSVIQNSLYCHVTMSWQPSRTTQKQRFAAEKWTFLCILLIIVTLASIILLFVAVLFLHTVLVLVLVLLLFPPSPSRLLLLLLPLLQQSNNYYYY